MIKKIRLITFHNKIFWIIKQIWIMKIKMKQLMNKKANYHKKIKYKAI